MQLTLARLLLLVLLLVQADGYGAEQNQNADQKVAEGIVRNELIPRNLTKTGFQVPPQKIDYEHDPKLQPLLDRWPTLWKSVEVAVANEYEKRQKALNDKARPNAGKWRKILKDAFEKACELRGGGSRTAALWTYSGAQTEWLISQYHPVSDPYISNDKFAAALKKDFEDLSQEELPSYKEVAAKLSEIDRFLTKPEAAFIRKEFLAYFKD